MASDSVSAAPEVTTAGLGYDEIRALLPHEEPFIFVERVIELEPRRRILCLKNVACNEWYLRAHFPGFAVMPGVLMVEALAQAALLLVRLSYPERRGELGVLQAARTRFHRVVVPGDQLLLEATLTKVVSFGCIASTKATVDGQAAVTAELTFGIADKEKLLKRRGA